MPVSHIGLTVSHLPTSTSFFLSALQPLGYRYIGQSGDQIGLGIHDADFFLCQETPGVKAGAAHIAFTAPSSAAVRNFYSAALTAGGRPNGAPAARCDEDGHFNAAVLDFDGNSIEVVYRNGPDVQNDGTVISHSRVIRWRRSVSETYHDERSVVSRAPSMAQSQKAPSVVARSVSEPVAVQQTAPASDAGDGAAKKIIGTLLGAAAGAAVAYAMVQSEKDSAKKENDFSALMTAKTTIQVAANFINQVTPQPPSQAPSQAPQPAQEVPAQPEAAPVPSPPRSVFVQQQIEAAPSAYFTPPGSRAPSHVGEPRAIEYAPACSVAPSQARSRYTAPRSVTSPELLTIEKARSVVSATSRHSNDARSVAPSQAPSESRSIYKPQRSATNPEYLTVEKARSTVSRHNDDARSVAASTLISSFIPDVPRRGSEGSVASHRSSRSKAKSSHDHGSEVSSHSRHSKSSKSSKSRKGETEESSPPSDSGSQAPSKPPSKAASIVGSILGRYNKATASNHGDFTEEPKIEEVTEDEDEDDDFDFETVVPSDSVSQAGSRRRRVKKHRDSGSTVSKSSSSSKHSKHSHRSSRSHKSRSHDHSDGSSAESEKHRRHRSSRPSVISEPSDASTIKPIKHKLRKDSVTQGQYDGLFDEVQTGFGSATPSMISAAGKNQHRGMVNYNMAQRVRAFET